MFMMMEYMRTGAVETYNVRGGAYHAGTRVVDAACAWLCVMMRAQGAASLLVVSVEEDTPMGISPLHTLPTPLPLINSLLL